MSWHTLQNDTTDLDFGQNKFEYRCTLSSINITKFISRNRTDLNWEYLADAVRLSVRFLDNVIDVNHYQVPEIKKLTLGNRKIGFGIMGFADTLVLLGIRYASKDAAEFAGKLASFIQVDTPGKDYKHPSDRCWYPSLENWVFLLGADRLHA